MFSFHQRSSSLCTDTLVGCWKLIQYINIFSKFVCISMQSFYRQQDVRFLLFSFYSLPACHLYPGYNDKSVFLNKLHFLPKDITNKMSQVHEDKQKKNVLFSAPGRLKRLRQECAENGAYEKKIIINTYVLFFVPNLT